MKFSWKWLNEIINLQNLSLEEISIKLTLAGFEIDNIDYIDNIKDTIIDLSIPANRPDISCMIGIAREISSIFNITLNKNLNCGYYNSKIRPESLDNLCINTIINIKNIKSPLWLKKYLQCNEIKSQNILYDTIEYIKIKWGVKINIINTTDSYINYIETKSLLVNNYINKGKIIDLNLQLGIKKNSIKLTQHDIDTISNNIKLNSSISKIIIYAYTNNNTSLYTTKINQYNLDEKTNQEYICDVFIAYNEALQILRTYTKGIQGKVSVHRGSAIKNQIIQLKQIYIQQILGSIKKRPTAFLKTHEILQIFTQLYFQPKYNNIKHEFQISIPLYRQNDIIRPIDAIEEIGRIYGFNNFTNSLPKKINQGSITNNTKIIKRTRQILRDMGLNEVVHYSLKKQYTNLNQIRVHNPIIQDQAVLQTNIVTNLINTKKYNIKQKNLNIEYFEIGKIFNNKKIYNKIYQEKIHIAGIIGNRNFTRKSWTTKPHEMNWFEAKGILEDLFEKLSATICWQPYNKKNTPLFIASLKDVINPERSAYICSPQTGNIIGLLAEIINQNKNLDCVTYIFEINFELLSKSINNSRNTDYTFENYSTYPSVIRDISIVLNKSKYINEIKNKILKKNYALLESIEIFNEYKNRYQKGDRSIGLRITYRSKTKTLKDDDLMNTNKEIDQLLEKYIK